MRAQREKQHETTTNSINEAQDIQSVQLQDPDQVKTKGREKRSNKRTKPMGEKIKDRQKQKYRCQNCKKSGHNTSSCPTNPKNTGSGGATKGRLLGKNIKTKKLFEPSTQKLTIKNFAGHQKAGQSAGGRSQ